MQEKQVLITETSLKELQEMLEEGLSKQLRELKLYIDSGRISTQQSPNDSPADKLITEKELAERTGITRQTLKKYRDSGKLKNVRSLEPRIRYTQESLDEF